MNGELPRKKINCTITQPAQDYILKILPGFAASMSERGLALAFNWSGGGRTEKNGQVTWEYSGPMFTFGGQRPKSLGGDEPYDLLGYTVWMRWLDVVLLKGRVLTLMMVGSPEPHNELVIENAPADYFQKFTRESERDCSCCQPQAKQGV